MYDGNQVLRFESKYKAKDLGGLGVELTQRKGTGNYADKEYNQIKKYLEPGEKAASANPAPATYIAGKF